MSVSNEILTSSAVRAVEASIDLAHVRPEQKSKSLSGSVRGFLVLAKPEITLMVMISAAVASLMASDSLRIIVLVHSVVGIGLLAAGASVLNQFFERELDGRMRRTARRPLPAEELSPRQALVFGVAVSSAGMLYVFLLLNALTAMLGLLTLVSYLFIYTPLKTKTSLCTFVGAFPGAAPVLMGWSATTNNLTLEAAALFASLFPAFIAHAGRLYFASAMILGICFYHFAYHAAQSRSKLAAKRLLHASVLYLPLLYLFML